MKVRAYGSQNSEAVMRPLEIERRAPGDRDVVITIEHCGICHSDIHFAKNEWGMATYPCVPGHEIVGRVTGLGRGVRKHRVDDLVGVGCLVDSCRTCTSCMDGLENYCEKGFTLTYGSILADGSATYGGYSTQIVVHEDFVLKVPKSLDPAAAAPLLCAGITTYSPLRHVGVSSGHRIAVNGLGGLGHMAVKLAHAMGAEVTVFTRTASKGPDAKRLGADEFVVTSERGALDRYQGHFDFILNTVSAPHDMIGPLGALRRDGTMILVGASPDPLPLPTFPLLFGRRTVLGSLIGGIPETQEMLDFCGTHGIVSEIEEIDPTRIDEAYKRTLASDVKYRFVIDCRKM